MCQAEILLFKTLLSRTTCLASRQSITNASALVSIFQEKRNFHSLCNINHDNYSVSRYSLSYQSYREVQFRRTAQTPLASKYNMEWPKITLFGDSITRRSMDVDNGCWGSMIAHEVGSYFDVDFRGFEGYNTRWALDLIPQLFPKSYLEKVEVFIIFFGHNDSWIGPMIGVPVDEYENNLRTMIKYLTENGLDKSKLILITPTWYYDDDFQAYMKELGLPPIGKTIEHATKYSEAVLRVAGDTSIDVVNFFEVSKKHEPLKDMFCDGVHYSRNGAKMLFEYVWPIVKRKIEFTYKKPLVDIWHVTPMTQRPEVEEYMKKYYESQDE